MALKAIALLFLREVSEILILKKGGMSISCEIHTSTFCVHIGEMGLFQSTQCLHFILSARLFAHTCF